MLACGDVRVNIWSGRYNKYEAHFEGPDMGRGGAEYIVENSGIKARGMTNYYNKDHAMFEIYYSEVDEWKSKIREFFNKVKATGLELKEYSKKTEEEIEAIMKRLDASKNDVSSEAKIANETD